MRRRQVARWAFRGGLAGVLLAALGSGTAFLFDGPFGGQGLPSFVLGLTFGLIFFAVPAAAVGAVVFGACGLL